MRISYHCSCTLTSVLILLSWSGIAWAQDPILARTPPMGWNSWNHFACDVSDAVVRAQADALVTTGMRSVGYAYILIDDCWQGTRDDAGYIRPNAKFPDMKALADYIHGKGLKIGIYSSPGPKTCGGYEGSYRHEQQDANTYASWGVDFLKYDLCSYMDIMKLHDPSQDPHQAQVMMQEAYSKMHEALVNTHRPIVYSLCQYGVDSVLEWGPQVGGNMWRTTDDMRDNYGSMALDGFSQPGLEKSD